MSETPYGEPEAHNDRDEIVPGKTPAPKARNPITGNKPVECPICGRRVKDDYALSRHTASLHPNHGG